MILKYVSKVLAHFVRFRDFFRWLEIIVMELTRGNSDNYKDIFQTVSISITKIYTRKNTGEILPVFEEPMFTPK